MAPVNPEVTGTVRPDYWLTGHAAMRRRYGTSHMRSIP